MNTTNTSQSAITQHGAPFPRETLGNPTALLKWLNSHRQGDGTAFVTAGISAIVAISGELRALQPPKLEASIAIAFVAARTSLASQIWPGLPAEGLTPEELDRALAERMGLGTSPGVLSECRRVGSLVLDLHEQGLPLSARFATYRDLLVVCDNRVHATKTLYRCWCDQGRLDEAGLERAIAVLRDDEARDDLLSDAEMAALQEALPAARRLVGAGDLTAEAITQIWTQLQLILGRAVWHNPRGWSHASAPLACTSEDGTLTLTRSGNLPPDTYSAITTLVCLQGWEVLDPSREASPLTFALSSNQPLARRQSRAGAGLYHAIVTAFRLQAKTK